MHLSNSGAPPAKRLCPCSLPAIAPPRPHLDALLHIDDLPDEILGAIFCRLTCLDTTTSVPLVCHRWRRVNGDPLVVPLRTCDPCADDSTPRKRESACVPTCPLAPVRTAFRLAMGRRLPDDFGRRERPSDAVFCLYARKRDRFSDKWAAFADRCRPLDSRPCELSAQNNGSLNVLDLANARWPCSPRVFAWCVARGTALSRLVALISAGCPIDNPVVGMACAWHGRTDVLSLLVGFGARHAVDARAWQVAAMRGHIEWMAAARTRGFPRPTQACAQAAAWAGHVDIVAWVQDECDLCDPSVVTSAVASGASVAVLDVLVNSGWAVAPEAVTKAASRGAVDRITYLWSVLDKRHVPTGQTRSVFCCIEAARQGHLDCLAYLWVHGCPWDERVCAAAASNGHLDCLQYARENGCPWDVFTCRAAAASGHFMCLTYAHKNRCNWDETTCEAAAAGGHLACLAYAHQNGCRWDQKTTIAAAANGHTVCLAYAHEYGCPWDATVVEAALLGGHRDCVAYAHRHGCPCRPSACHLYCARERWDVKVLCGRPCSLTTTAARRRQRHRIAMAKAGPPPWAVACTSRPFGANHDPWNRLLASLAHQQQGTTPNAASTSAAIDLCRRR